MLASCRIASHAAPRTKAMRDALSASRTARTKRARARARVAREQANCDAAPRGLTRNMSAVIAAA